MTFLAKTKSIVHQAGARSLQSTFVHVARRVEKTQCRAASPLHAQRNRPLEFLSSRSPENSEEPYGRPRKSLDDMKPIEKHAEHVALTPKRLADSITLKRGRVQTH